MGVTVFILHGETRVQQMAQEPVIVPTVQHITRPLRV